MSYLPWFAGGALAGYALRRGQGRRGVYDPGILKAVFLAGGPGSGKSFVASRAFSLSESSFAPSGLKLVNSDVAFEMIMEREGLDMGKIAEMDPFTLQYVTMDPKGPRGRGKRLTQAQMAVWMDERLGLIIDGTGKNYDKIAGMKAALEDMGYDTAMIFVNTTLQVAMERNRMRARKLPDKQVKKMWEQVQSNLGAFQTLFTRRNFYLVDNSDPEPIGPEVIRPIMRFVRRPIRNPIGKSWVQMELALKGMGIRRRR